MEPNQEIFFKEIGEPIKLKAKIRDARIFFGLDEEKAKRVFDQSKQCCCFCKDVESELFEKFSRSNYAFFVRFDNPCVIKPFEITEREITDYWLPVETIESIKTT